MKYREKLIELIFEDDENAIIDNQKDMQTEFVKEEILKRNFQTSAF